MASWLDSIAKYQKYGAYFGVSYGGSGTYGQQVDKYKCHGFLIFLGRETMGSNVLTTVNKYRF